MTGGDPCERARTVALIEFVGRTRHPYQGLFPNKQEDAFWNVGEIPYATAMRRIGDWIAEGLIDKCKRSEKSFMLQASASMLSCFSRYAGNIKSLIAQTTGMRRAGEEEKDYYFGT